ncbi:phosphatase [filamentous cyanobacterium CCP5]|nr:phosphatase [filamentous cyanobacterium CCP5]
MLSLHKVTPTPEKVKHLLTRYGELLPSSLPRRQGQVMPGVLQILEALRSQPNILSLLLTGNIQAGAQAKLHHYGLASYFDQVAFSDEAENRPAIAHQGLALAKTLVGEIQPEKVYVIGDTPHDIHCGQAIQARTIAVATGSYSVSQLQVHTPWWLIEQLPSPVAFFEKVGLPAQ